MPDTVVTPHLVVLRASAWVEELSLELELAGVADPSLCAKRALQHICGRAGFYRSAFIVDDEVPATGEERP